MYLWLEVNLGVIVAALEELLHFFLARLTRVGTSASIANGVLCNFRQSFQENVLRNKAVLGRIAVSTIVLDAVRDVQVIIHLSQIFNEQLNFLDRKSVV